VAMKLVQMLVGDTKNVVNVMSNDIVPKNVNKHTGKNTYHCAKLSVAATNRTSY
tara:strand:+ start:1643 stop:1804 length:162 start_codon:yes stop_codon:yes gene_type:complete